VIVVVPLQAGLLGEPGRAAGLRRAGQPRGAWAAERTRAVRSAASRSLVKSRAEPPKFPGMALCVSGSGGQGTMAASGWPRGAFLNPLPHPRGRSDPTTDQGSSVSPTPADARQQRFAVVAHVNSGQPLGPLSPDVPSKLVAGPLRVLWGRMPFMGEDAEAEITGDEELPQGPFGSISFANSGAGPSGEARVASRLRMVRTGFPAGPGSLGRGSVGGRPRCGRRAACPPAPSG
jgi:hypothetical protein